MVSVNMMLDRDIDIPSRAMAGRATLRRGRAQCTAAGVDTISKISVRPLASILGASKLLHMRCGSARCVAGGADRRVRGDVYVIER